MSDIFFVYTVLVLCFGSAALERQHTAPLGSPQSPLFEPPSRGLRGRKDIFESPLVHDETDFTSVQSYYTWLTSFGVSLESLFHQLTGIGGPDKSENRNLKLSKETDVFSFWDWKNYLFGKPKSRSKGYSRSIDISDTGTTGNSIHSDVQKDKYSGLAFGFDLNVRSFLPEGLIDFENGDPLYAKYSWPLSGILLQDLSILRSPLKETSDEKDDKNIYQSVVASVLVYQARRLRKAFHFSFSDVEEFFRTNVLNFPYFDSTNETYLLKDKHHPIPNAPLIESVPDKKSIISNPLSLITLNPTLKEISVDLTDLKNPDRLKLDLAKEPHNDSKVKHRTKRNEETICYQEHDHDLGCFRDDGPFDYFDLLPSRPEEVETEFYVYTRQNPNKTQLYSFKNLSSIIHSNIDAKRKTKFIIHGFGSSCNRVWVREMRDTFLLMEDVNVICVQWEKGASIPNYPRAASNTRLVGRQVAVLLGILNTLGNVSFSDVHLVGFSLGAHVSGYAGERLNGRIGRISGLDPAGPFFEKFPPSMRLDPEDAAFVDVIHTNAESIVKGGLAAYEPMGHVDFYPNGGKFQKGCNNLFVGGFRDLFWPREGDGRYLCNHRRGYKYFVESMVPICKFPSFSCTDYESFLKGECFPCDKCGNMGYFADKSPGRGKMYLVTRDTEPFCANQYKVEVHHSGGPPATSPVITEGRLRITFITVEGLNETLEVTRKKDEKMEAGEKTIRIVVPHPALSNMASLQLEYTAHQGWISSGYNRWAIDKISIMDSFGNVQSFCHRGTTLVSGLKMPFPLGPGDCNPRELPLHVIHHPYIDAGENDLPSHSATINTSPGIGPYSRPPVLNVSSVSSQYDTSPKPSKPTKGPLSSTFSVIHASDNDNQNITKYSTSIGSTIPPQFNSTNPHLSTKEYLAWKDAPPPNLEVPNIEFKPGTQSVSIVTYDKKIPQEKSHTDDPVQDGYVIIGPSDKDQGFFANLFKFPWNDFMSGNNSSKNPNININPDKNFSIKPFGYNSVNEGEVDPKDKAKSISFPPNDNANSPKSIKETNFTTFNIQSTPTEFKQYQTSSVPVNGKMIKKEIVFINSTNSGNNEQNHKNVQTKFSNDDGPRPPSTSLQPPKIIIPNTRVHSNNYPSSSHPHKSYHTFPFSLGNFHRPLTPLFNDDHNVHTPHLGYTNPAEFSPSLKKGRPHFRHPKQADLPTITEDSQYVQILPAEFANIPHIRNFALPTHLIAPPAKSSRLMGRQLSPFRALTRPFRQAHHRPNNPLNYAGVHPQVRGRELGQLKNDYGGVLYYQPFQSSSRPEFWPNHNAPFWTRSQPLPFRFRQKRRNSSTGEKLPFRSPIGGRSFASPQAQFNRRSEQPWHSSPIHTTGGKIRTENRDQKNLEESLIKGRGNTNIRNSENSFSNPTAELRDQVNAESKSLWETIVGPQRRIQHLALGKPPKPPIVLPLRQKPKANYIPLRPRDR